MKTLTSSRISSSSNGAPAAMASSKRSKKARREPTKHDFYFQFFYNLKFLTKAHFRTFILSFNRFVEFCSPFAYNLKFKTLQVKFLIKINWHYVTSSAKVCKVFKHFACSRPNGVRAKSQSGFIHGLLNLSRTICETLSNANCNNQLKCHFVYNNEPVGSANVFGIIQVRVDLASHGRFYSCSGL